MEQFGESPNLTRPSEAVTSDTFHYVLFLHILNNATVDWQALSIKVGKGNISMAS